MTEVADRDTQRKWDAKRQGITRTCHLARNRWMWVPTSATLIYGERDAVSSE
jgi:hypothetical protein